MLFKAMGLLAPPPALGRVKCLKRAPMYIVIGSTPLGPTHTLDVYVEIIQQYNIILRFKSDLYDMVFIGF